jgi:murein tripeptide amidase MpaA
MIEGVINFLTSEHEIAKILRSKFIFKIVPMLNPDGVIHGNYRTNLAGIDLNRVWNSTDKQLSP